MRTGVITRGLKQGEGSQQRGQDFRRHGWGNNPSIFRLLKANMWEL